MKTKKQEELIHTFISLIRDEDKPLYQDIILYLSELGYSPTKEKSNISFKHDLHNKQIAKIGIKKKEAVPYFALRFSACRNYPKKYDSILSAYADKYPSRVARCINDGCNYCSGDAGTHVYECMSRSGERKAYCGAYAVEIQDIKADNIEEIKKLIKEEHEYLIKHEKS